MDLSGVTQHESLVGRERRTNRACKGSLAKHGIEHMALSTWHRAHGRLGKDEEHTHTFSGLDTGTRERLSRSAEVLLSNTHRCLSEHNEKNPIYGNKDKHKVKSRV